MRRKTLKSKNKNLYRIFWLDNGKKIEMQRFSAANRGEAYAELKKYIRVANKEHKYYYEELHEVRVCDEKGNVIKTYDSIHESFADRDSSLWENITFWFSCQLSKVKDFFRWWSDLFYWIRHGHDRKEHWSLDMHILDDLRYNIPLIIKYNYGCPQQYIEKAIKKRFAKDENFNLKAYLQKTNYSGDEKDMENGIKLLKADLNALLLHVRLYDYFSSFGIFDEKDKDMVEIDKKFRKQLPIHPGTYDEIDYAKNENLVQYHWNFIWNWLKEKGYYLAT